MRQLGNLGDRQQAQKLADYLLTLGIKTQIDSGADGNVIWVRDEDRLPQAREELERFLAAPDDARYRVGREADRIRAEQQAYAKRFQKNQIDVRRRWAGSMAGRRGPVTLALIGISVVVGLLTNFGTLTNDPSEMGKFNKEATLACLIATQLPVEGAPLSQQLPDIFHGQVWRLVTPIFLHMNVLHLVFNMLMLVQLGGMVESRRGPLRFALLVLSIAVVSNLGQWAIDGPVFGGMSGVNYGLFGYIWMKSRYEPGSGMFLSQNVVFWMLAFFVLCFTPLISNVANGAHAVGLGMGVVIGIAPRLWRR